MTDSLQALRILGGRLSNMLARGRVASVKATTKMQTLQVQLLAGETKDRLEHFEPYGFTSCPNAGAEAAVAFLDGDRSHGIVLVVADRRFRLTALAAGEVALHDDQGQKVHLTRTGIVVDGGGKNIMIQNAPLTTMTGNFKVNGTIAADGNISTAQSLSAVNGVSTNGNLNVNGNIVAVGDISDQTSKSMRGMRTVFNAHTHAGAVPTPTPGM